MAVFAFATVIAWFYLGKQALTYLTIRCSLPALFSRFLYPMCFLSAILAGKDRKRGKDHGEGKEDIDRSGCRDETLCCPSDALDPSPDDGSCKEREAYSREPERKVKGKGQGSNSRVRLNHAPHAKGAQTQSML